MKPSPGDRIIITLNMWDDRIPHHFEATKGSLARALSFEEYIKYHKEKPSLFRYHPEYVEKCMKQGELFPFQLEYVAPLVPKEAGIVLCKIGEAILLSEWYFQILKDDD